MCTGRTRTRTDASEERRRGTAQPAGGAAAAAVLNEVSPGMAHTVERTSIQTFAKLHVLMTDGASLENVNCNDVTFPHQGVWRGL
mmetsp:Transcript_3476/g.5419  ORF Transcript_3476/g.5419 Transcript_3476/m.5419 type:complete len:85 (+) Transcript_3476:281-535(+)